MGVGNIFSSDGLGDCCTCHHNLVRGTLASWEARLIARGFVRVHRSRLVNRSKIAALAPTRSGDIEISPLDGCTVAGSRRYRAQLSERKPA